MVGHWELGPFMIMVSVMFALSLTGFKFSPLSLLCMQNLQFASFAWLCLALLGLGCFASSVAGFVSLTLERGKRGAAGATGFVPCVLTVW